MCSRSVLDDAAFILNWQSGSCRKSWLVSTNQMEQLDNVWCI